MKSIFRKVIFSLLVAAIVTVVSMPFAAESVQAAKCLNAGRLVDCDTIFGNRPKSQDSHTGPAIVPEPSSSQTVWWSGVSSDLSDAILQLSRQNRTIKQVAFTAEGGWLILFLDTGEKGMPVKENGLCAAARGQAGMSARGVSPSQCVKSVESGPIATMPTEQRTVERQPKDQGNRWHVGKRCVIEYAHVPGDGAE